MNRLENDDSQTRGEYLPDSGFQQEMSQIAHPPGGHRRLSSDQRSALLQVPQRVPAAAAPREFLAHLVSLIGRVLETKAAVAGKHEGAWVVAVESAPTPSLSHLHNGGSHAFDSVGLTLGLGVDVWRSEDHDWTLVGLAAAPSTPVILLLEGDWTGSAQDLVTLA